MVFTTPLVAESDSVCETAGSSAVGPPGGLTLEELMRAWWPALCLVALLSGCGGPEEQPEPEPQRLPQIRIVVDD